MFPKFLCNKELLERLSELEAANKELRAQINRTEERLADATKIYTVQSGYSYEKHDVKEVVEQLIREFGFKLEKTAACSAYTRLVKTNADK